MKVSEIVQWHWQAIEKEKAIIVWLEQNEDLIESLPGLSLSYNSIDFDHLPHDEVMKVILAFPGKWTKTPNWGDPTKIDYTLNLENGITLRCWNGFPPESCQIVETIEEVPAQPAHQKIVRKLVCV